VGIALAADEPRSGERIFRRYAAHLLPIDSTASGRGYTLSPLRGCIVLRLSYKFFWTAFGADLTIKVMDIRAQRRKGGDHHLPGVAPRLLW
jgi:hypothetical protein